MGNLIDDITTKRQERARHELGDAILDDLGAPDADRLAQTVDSTPDMVREAMVEALERNRLWREHDRQRAACDEAEGLPGDRCCNMVCPEYRQNEGWEKQPDGSLLPVNARKDFCQRGAVAAQGCMFRMREHPPSDPFIRLPSHAEAVHMLQRAGLLTPDDFGRYNGTDFAQRRETRRLWWAYVDALIACGRVDPALDRGNQGRAAKALLAAVPETETEPNR